MKTANHSVTASTLLTSTSTAQKPAVQVASRSNKAKNKLNQKATFIALTNHIECEISSLNSKFQSFCDKLKAVSIREYETMTTLQKRIDFYKMK